MAGRMPVGKGDPRPPHSPLGGSRGTPTFRKGKEVESGDTWDRRPPWCLLLVPSALPFCGRPHAGHWKHGEELEQCLQEADGPGDKEPRRYLIGKGEMEGSALP